MRDQVLRNLRRHAEDEVQDARRQAGIDVGLDQRSAACRRLFRPLDDYRTAGCERRRNLADRLIDRKVPRRERRDGTDRLLPDDLVDAFGTGRADASLAATPFFGGPVDDVGAGEGLPLRLVDGLSLLPGDLKSLGKGKSVSLRVVCGG